MNSMIEQYEPDLENNKCKCGQAELFSAMINKKLPCIHLYYLEKKFPLVDPPSLNIVDSFYGEMTFEYHIQQSEKIETNSDYYDNIRVYVVKKIKRNSHSQEKDEIIAFVKKELPFNETPKEFVLGYPSEIFQVIDKGIVKFSINKTSPTPQNLEALTTF